MGFLRINVALIEKSSEKFKFARLNKKGHYAGQFEPINASTYFVKSGCRIMHFVA